MGRFFIKNNDTATDLMKKNRRHPLFLDLFSLLSGLPLFHFRMI